ncbi:DUF4013 domain-containing protein [Haloarcula laminariae]|uniref:DUF4013 domain-containing protein n=1 Tax=Haloarcula laminariae TaxID=2961577 RepID=UPI0024077133|nr:DUF4013 domain-containing protein [Halomicroarcula sp. FL173]
MIEAALRYQTQGEDWIKRVGIGGVLLFFFWLFIPILTVYGYMMEVIRQVLRGDKSNPPKWGDFDMVSLTIQGAKAFAILFAYGIVVGLVAGIPSAVLSFIGALIGSQIFSLLGSLLGFVLNLVASLLVAIVAPVVLSNFVLKDEIAAGFDIDVLRQVGTSGTMLRAVGLAIVVSILMQIVSAIVGITIIGLFVVPFIFFVGFSAIVFVWATGFADAYREEIGELPEIPDGPVKPGVEQQTAAGTTAASEEPTAADEDAATTADTPADIADTNSESEGTDEDRGPDPTDDERWD